MVSEAKIEANRRNAQKSTGPRTMLGKLRSSLNGFKPGLRLDVSQLAREDSLASEERKMRIEDALGATRAAVADGIIPGGGVGLVVLAHPPASRASTATAPSSSGASRLEPSNTFVLLCGSLSREQVIPYPLKSRR